MSKSKIVAIFIIIFATIFAVDFIFNYQENLFDWEIFIYRDFHYQIRQGIRLINYLLQIAIVIAFITSTSKITRYFMAIMLFITYSIYFTYYFLNGTGFVINNAYIILSEYTFAKEAFATYYPVILKAMAVSALFVGAIYFLGQFIRHRLSKYILFGALLAVSIFYSRFITFSTADFSFTIPFKVTFDFYKAASAPLYANHRAEVTQKIIQKPLVDKIVYIVDESIKGNILSLNGYKVNTTPFLVKNRDKLINYGIASSVGNCSAISNLILRSDLPPSAYPDVNQSSLKHPNIWGYAKKAGYYTVYLDAQGTSMQNHMNRFDLESIDEFIQVRNRYNIKEYESDFKALDILQDILKKHKRVFVYINKMGAHFPYEYDYPKNQTIYKPALEMNEAPSYNEKQKFLNTFYNALRWSVDKWWQEVFKRFENQDALFIYTSDHGQNLFDRDSKETHCSNDPIVDEAIVPIFLAPFGNTKDLINKLAKNVDKNYNHAWGFNIFPTILYLEGYKLKENQKSLFDDLSNQKRFFLSGDPWGRDMSKINDFLY